MEFSEKLRTLRTQRGISQAKLAAEIHISRSAVAKWENGLGLPSDESLYLLASYFQVDIKEFLPDKDNAETIISKNKTIVTQKHIIIGLLACIGIGGLLLAFLLCKPIRPVIPKLGLGILLLLLGGFNMKGNIASIHWYQRRRVTKENQKAYCLGMGIGTCVIGACLCISGIAQVCFHSETIGAVILSVGLFAGLVPMLYVQFKYNRGLF